MENNNDPGKNIRVLLVDTLMLRQTKVELSEKYCYLNLVV